MFNLEQAITEWRQQMLAAGIKTPAPLEELESHLREEIERQTDSGLSEAEAFPSAVQKIGAAQVLQNEFRKAEAIKADRQWQNVQILLLGFTALNPILCASVLFSKPGGSSQMTPGQIGSGLAAVALLSLFAWSGRLSYQFLPFIQTKRIRDAVHLAYFLPVTFWLITFACFIQPRYDFTVGQLMVALLWAIFPPVGVCIGLFWGMETAARKKVALAAS